MTLSWGNLIDIGWKINLFLYGSFEHESLSKEFFSQSDGILFWGIDFVVLDWIFYW